MQNKTKKCKSKCIGMPKEKCYKGCVFTRDGICKLSSKYKMDKRTCKLMRRTYHIPQSFKIPKKEDIMPSYSPEINRFLVQSRRSAKYDIFEAITYCMKIDVDAYNIKDSVLKYYLNPRIQTKSGECVAYWNTDAQKLFLDNLSKHHQVNIQSLIGPKQSYYNCWFNTGFMINYVSDKGRKFNKFFRQYMITGKMRGIKPFIKNLKAPLFLFNIAIEATLQGNPLAKIMNTNDIIEMIYKNIPKEYKKYNSVRNTRQSGNPYSYQMALLNYLSEHKPKYKFIDGKDFFLNSDRSAYTDDLLWVELTDAASRIVSNKTTELTIHKNSYTLDSILLRDEGQEHFCCLLTINQEEYLYDGAETPSITPLKWKNMEFLNGDRQFKVNSTPLRWNMRSGYQVLNYYRVNA